MVAVTRYVHFICFKEKYRSQMHILLYMTALYVTVCMMHRHVYIIHYTQSLIRIEMTDEVGIKVNKEDSSNLDFGTMFFLSLCL